MPKHTFETDDDLIEAAKKLGLIPKPKHAFDTDAEFFAAADKRATKKVKEAVDEAVGKVLEKLDVDSVDEIEEKIATKLKDAGAVGEELKKLQGQLKKTEKERDTEKARADSLGSFRTKHLKQQALLKHAPKVIDPEVLDALVGNTLVVGDDDTVSGPDGKTVDKIVDEFLAAKPHLKAADYKPGAGSGSREKPPEGGSKPNGAPAQPPTLDQALAGFSATLRQSTQSQ